MSVYYRSTPPQELTILELLEAQGEREMAKILTDGNGLTASQADLAGNIARREEEIGDLFGRG